MGTTGAHDAGEKKYYENEQGHPISNPLQSFVSTRYSCKVEPSEKVPVDNVFNVEFDGSHDDPEEVPGEGGDEGKCQHYPRPGHGAVGGARGRGFLSHSQIYTQYVYLQSYNTLL